jgi:iron complex transport system ATP-binding protein
VAHAQADPVSLLVCNEVDVDMGERRVLDKVSADLGAGSLVGLLGPNGAGKTTLLRTLAGLLRPHGGHVVLLGRELTSYPARELARVVGYLAQDATCHWAMTVENVVALGRLPHRPPWAGNSAQDLEAITRAMGHTDVGPLAQRAMDTLSGGERARVLLARALAGTPQVLLADEPVNGLDPAHQLDVMSVLQRLASAGAAVVVVMHDLTLAARYCDRVILLDAGQVLADGAPDKVLSDENLQRCFAIRAHTAEVDGRRLILPLARTGD